MFGSSQWMYNSGSTYEIEQSLRFNDDSNTYLSRTPSTPGNQTTWTISLWLKRSTITNNYQRVFSARGNAGELTEIVFNNEGSDTTKDNLVIEHYRGGSQSRPKTRALFKDVAAWYHIVVAYDTNHDSPEDRMKLYVNGARITEFESWSAIEKGADTYVNSTYSHKIGDGHDYSINFDGYMAEIHLIDGQQLDATYFGEINEDYGNWIPKEFNVTSTPKGSYGTNGFYLDFGSSNGGYEADKSGNGNNWTATNMSAAVDVVLDSPTNNFATLNPLFWNPTRSNKPQYSEGNLKGAYVADAMTEATMSVPSSGKWYYEVRTTGDTMFGWGLPTIWGGDTIGQSTFGVGLAGIGIHANGQWLAGNSYIANTGVSFSSGTNIIQIALDLDNNKIYYGKNGSWTQSGVPASNTGGQALPSNLQGESLIPAFRISNSGSDYSIVNFGQDSSFAGELTAQGNTDSRGRGDFYYTPPSGFLAICTANMPDPAVKPKENFNMVLYGGTGSQPRSITGVGFQPDFVWLKSRDSSYYHQTYDAVRGTGSAALYPNSNDDQDAPYYLNSFDSNGVTLGTNLINVNRNGEGHIGYFWKGNNSSVSNTNGSITSTVSANQDAGFSIVKYPTSTSEQTVGHGLNSPPELIIVKSINRVINWDVWHKDFGTYQALQLNTSNAKYTNSGYRTVYSTSNTTFGAGMQLIDSGSFGSEMIAYCFHSVDGYSKIGSYKGNGSNDGSFVHTGFRPAFVLIKSVSGHNWWIGDSSREPYNGGKGTYEWLRADDPSAEVDYTAIAHMSNGFKFLDSHSGLNGANDTYIYLAFAEHPFKYANARGTSYDKLTDVAPTQLTIGQSLRFNDDDTAYLSRTPSAAGNRRTWTTSFWMKTDGGTGGQQAICSARHSSDSNQQFAIWHTNGEIDVETRAGRIQTKALLRDVSSWYHIVVVMDTPHPTASERCRIYINGERAEVDTLTSFTQNTEHHWNTTLPHTIGKQANASSLPWGGYLADYYFVDGQALSPDRFGYFDSTYGDWRPRNYGVDGDGTPEANYGANGFRLTFNSGSARIDQSGMGNHFTVNNFSESTDVVLDSPSNNFATWNKLSTDLTLREGALNVDYAANDLTTVSTIGAKTGKWYWEIRLNVSTTGICYGIVNDHSHRAWTPSDQSATQVYGFYGFQNTISKRANGAGISGNLPSVSGGSILMFALDCDNNRLWVGADGTWLDSGNPGSNSNPTFTGLDPDRWWFPVIEMRNTADNINVNFGQDGTMAGLITAGNNSDANGIGNFKYSVPSGFKSLCTANIDNPSVVPHEHFDTKLYKHTGEAENVILDDAASIDFVWIKSRNQASNHRIIDSIRGRTISPNATSTESNDSSTYAFSGNRLNISNNTGDTNENSANFVAWAWSANGASAVSNTAGSITSTMKANTAAGFSIITYTGNGSSGATVGHGLGYEPDLVITKCRNDTQYWIIQHSSLSGRNYNMYFNTTDSQQPDYQYLSMSSSTLTLNGGSVNTNGNTYVSYCFREVPGYSKFGKYGANGSSNGAMIWCGFRPEFIIYKKYNASEVWYIHDEERIGYNPENRGQYIHSSVVEYDSDRIDIVSNGFKVRNADSDTGANGSDYIFWAFAKHPFKFTNAR